MSNSDNLSEINSVDRIFYIYVIIFVWEISDWKNLYYKYLVDNIKLKFF